MQKGQKLNVSFIGGSITVGAAATKLENTWVSRVSAFLKQRFKGFELNFFNVAISGTGTFFGAFRLREHVLKYDPDIVFIEFAVNDFWDAKEDRDRVISSLDYMIRTLIQSKPGIRLILTYSAMEDWAACADVHEEVARHYNIPSIDNQAHAKNLIEQSRYTWGELFSDFTHPTDLGHEIYANHIIESLQQGWGRFFSTSYQLGASLAKYPFSMPRIAGFEGVRLTGCWQIKRLRDQYHYVEDQKERIALYTDVPGSSLEFKFDGCYIGLYHFLDRHCGICAIQIDEEPEIKQDFYYDTADEFLCFFKKVGLEPGSHTLKLTVLEAHNEKSLGNQFGVAGFLVD